MRCTRYFLLVPSKNGDLVTATGREIVLRLNSFDGPKGVLVGPVLQSAGHHRANRGGYRDVKTELIALIDGLLPEEHKLVCLDSKDEIVNHYRIMNDTDREKIRIQDQLRSDAKFFAITEAVSQAERIAVTTMFRLDAADEQPVVTIIMNDQYKIAAHVGEHINGAMIDATKTVRPWTAPEGSTMEEIIRNRFPKPAVYAI